MTNNNTPLLAAFGISLELSSEDMCNIVVGMRDSIPNDETRSPLEEVADVTKDIDAKTLFTGAVLFGYLLDAYENIDVSQVMNNNNRKT